MLTAADFAARLRNYLDVHGHRLALDDAAFATAAELVQTRIVVLGDAWDLLKFLNDDEYAIDPKAAARAGARRRRGAGRGAARAGRRDGLGGAADRGRAEDRAHRRPGPQTAQGVRTDPGGRHRDDDQPAAVRVAAAAGPGPQLAEVARGAGQAGQHSA